MPQLVPELIVSDLQRSLRFYLDVLGFSVQYERPEEHFAYLERHGAEIMLQENVGRVFLAAGLEYPYGRGVNFQIEVAEVEALYETVRLADVYIFLPLEEKWYRRDAVVLGNRQFIVQDPDGYLLRFFQDLGSRPAPA
jgi:catechol 2,3-dioxygenase-like lactoylglutathione lyase family enzyme